MSQLLSWLCPCCLFGPSYAPIQSDDAPPPSSFRRSHDSSRPATAVELTDTVDLDLERGGHVTDDELLPRYTIDEDAQLVEISPRLNRAARNHSSQHSTAAPNGGLFESRGAGTSRPSLPPLIIDSASASQITSVASSPSVKATPASWVRASPARHSTPSSLSRISRSTSSTSSATHSAATTAVIEEDTQTSSNEKSASLTSSLSTFTAIAPRALFSFTSPSSSSSSPSSATLLPTQLLSTLASAVKQLSSSPTFSQHSTNGSTPSAPNTAQSSKHESPVEDESADARSLDGTVRAGGRAHEAYGGAEHETEQSTEQTKQLAVWKESDDKKEAVEEDESAGQLIMGKASHVIRIPSPRRRQQSLVSMSPVLTGSSTQSTDPSLSAMTISPSVAPTSPCVSSAPGSPSSALLSSSFSSVASGVSLSSSLPSSTSPRSSPFASSQLSSSHPTPLRLDPHISDNLSSSSLAVPEQQHAGQPADNNGAGHLAAHSLPHETFHRRLSSAAAPSTTAAAAPPPPSIRTNPPSPATGNAATAPTMPSIPVALPSAAETPVVHFKKGENPLLSLNIPKGQLRVEHIQSIIALFSPPPVPSSSASSPTSLLSTLASHLTYIHLFNFLISAPRTVSSAVFKHFSQPILARHKPPNPRPSPNAQIGLLLLQFLTSHLVSISTSASALAFTFDFPRQADSFTLDVPNPEMFVIESRHPSDPTLVHPLNVVRKADSEVRRIVFSRVVRVMIGKDRGIVGLGSGDLSVKKVFSFSCDMRYERRLGEVDVDGSGRQVVEDTNGKVRVEHGHYVLARYDDWLVVTVLGQQVQIGLPQFTRVNE